MERPIFHLRWEREALYRKNPNQAKKKKKKKKNHLCLGNSAKEPAFPYSKTFSVYTCRVARILC